MAADTGNTQLYNLSNPDCPKGALRFVPLENNPDVMTSLVHKLGLSPTLSFHDVYSLDDPSLLAFMPRPVYALLLVFPVTTSYETFRTKEDEPIPVYEGSGPDEEVLWFKQTIRNACGMMGLLHLACNGSARNLIAPNTPLSDLITAATPLAPPDRARLIETSPSIAQAHASAAAQGDSAVPSAADEVDLHFVSFIKSPQDNVWELDGRRKGPLKRGRLNADEDLLSETALEVGVRRFLKGAGEDMRFSLLALAPTLD